MTPKEALALTRMVAAICPQQKFDEYTPDAWGDLLSDIRSTDAIEAVMNLGRRQPFIAPCEIRDEVKRIRDKRLAENPMPDPPARLGDVSRHREYIDWLKDTQGRIADGDLATASAPVLTGRAAPNFDGAFRQVERVQP